MVGRSLFSRLHPCLNQRLKAQAVARVEENHMMARGVMSLGMSVYGRSPRIDWILNSMVCLPCTNMIMETGNQIAPVMLRSALSGPWRYSPVDSMSARVTPESKAVVLVA